MCLFYHILIFGDVMLFIRLNSLMRQVLSIIRELSFRFRTHSVGHAAGQVAYFFTLSVFPFLIFTNAVIASLNIPTHTAISFLSPFLPEKLVSFITQYLEYINTKSGTRLLSFGIAVSLFSSSKSVCSLMRAFDLAYGEARKRRFISSAVFSVLFVVISAILLVLCIIVIALGNSFFSNLFDISSRIPFLTLWRWTAMALAVFFTLAVVYKKLPSANVTFIDSLPGALFSLISFLIFTAAFSFYVNHIASSSVFYGTIGAVILFMLWMYIAAIILILGAELNCAVCKLKNR